MGRTMLGPSPRHPEVRYVVIGLDNSPKPHWFFQVFFKKGSVPHDYRYKGYKSVPVGQNNDERALWEGFGIPTLKDPSRSDIVDIIQEFSDTRDPMTQKAEQAITLGIDPARYI